MVDEWEAQNIFTRSISSDILGVLIMDRDHLEKHIFCMVLG
jgi:hypothetical protein